MDIPVDEVNEAIADAIAGSRPRHWRVVTFGDAALRLAPPAYERLERAHRFDVTVDGPELNTAVALSMLGSEATWVTALPASSVGRRVLRAAQANGVDVSHVRQVPPAEGRVAVVYAERGADPREPLEIDDRESTALARVRPGAFDWQAILSEADALHVSGVTLGLSEGVRAEVMQAVKTANALGILVSLDLQYRTDGWTEAEARRAFHDIIRKVDVVLVARETLRTFFSIDGSYEQVLRSVIEKLGVAGAAMVRTRVKSNHRIALDAVGMGKSAVLLESDARAIDVDDRSGGNDAFAAGFLLGYLDNPQSLRHALELGAAAGSLAMSTPGSFLCATRDEVDALLDD